MSDSQIQAGGAPPPQPNTLNPLVLASTAILPGTPVYTASNGRIGPARTNTGATAYAQGISLIPAADGERGQYRYSGPVTLTSAEWAAVLDTGTELTPGAPYYVSQGVAGQLTKNVPVSGIVCLVGVATSDLCMLVAPSTYTIPA